MTGEETKTILALLVQLAKADGVVDLKEDLFIKLYAHKNSVDPGEFDRVCRSPEMYTRSLSSVQDKPAVFAKLCSFVHFDMEAAEAELAWCAKVGRDLDLGAEKVDSVIEAIRAKDAPHSYEDILGLINA
jgi:hypothetical protein